MNDILDHVRENMKALNIDPSAVETLAGLAPGTIDRIINGVEPMPARLLKFLDGIFATAKADSLFLKTRT